MQRPPEDTGFHWAITALYTVWRLATFTTCAGPGGSEEGDVSSMGVQDGEHDELEGVEDLFDGEADGGGSSSATGATATVWCTEHGAGMFCCTMCHICRAWSVHGMHVHHHHSP